MTGQLPLRRWAPAAPNALHAVELLTRGGQLGLDDAMSRLGAEAGDAAFVVVPIDTCDRAAIESAVSAYFRSGGRPRLCLAGSHATLQAAGDAAIVSERVGLLLDDITVDTPLSELIWDRLEGVRFEAGFVNRAARNLRLGCTLEAMLALARDLGLCTLGADAMPGGGSLAGRGSFDYLSVEPAPAKAAIKAHREAAAERAR